MLAYCGEESRSQILDLRGGLLERMDLPAALSEVLIPLAEELRRLDRKIDDLSREEPSPTSNAKLRQLRDRATQIERKFRDLQAQFPTEDVESRLSSSPE